MTPPLPSIISRLHLKQLRLLIALGEHRALLKASQQVAVTLRPRAAVGDGQLYDDLASTAIGWFRACAMDSDNGALRSGGGASGQLR